MKKYTECDIVRELLPLYIEQKTGEESNQFMEGHLLECKECSEVHRWMSADFSKEKDGDTVLIQPKKERRKRRRYVRRRWLAVGIGLAAYIALLGAWVVHTFWYLCR